MNNIFQYVTRKEATERKLIDGMNEIFPSKVTEKDGYTITTVTVTSDKFDELFDMIADLLEDKELQDTFDSINDAISEGLNNYIRTNKEVNGIIKNAIFNSCGKRYNIGGYKNIFIKIYLTITTKNTYKR